MLSLVAVRVHSLFPQVLLIFCVPCEAIHCSFELNTVTPKVSIEIPYRLRDNTDDFLLNTED